MMSTLTLTELEVWLTAAARLPTIYSRREFAAPGGLVSNVCYRGISGHGPDMADLRAMADDTLDSQKGARICNGQEAPRKQESAKFV